MISTINRYYEENFFNIIHAPIITDKTTKLLEKNQYCFKVDHKANKIEIKKAIETIFKVKIVNINTSHEPRKKRKVGRFSGYKKHYKKAIVTLSSNSSINLFSDQ